ncbi:hypothetical protein HMP0015_0306 [Acinetobacter haemolyticus ATCC 19194]|uniref:Uncharacterized protein n=1 Tax=Acinetobacter haemolyticus ATCC 19194 TaxID=707232 RepID=D4XKR4_ACIHA|nr:hypothetical protein HMP0015_0306 [Acinetobacter haemolyticus ATCC 19194]
MYISLLEINLTILIVCHKGDVGCTMKMASYKVSTYAKLSFSIRIICSTSKKNALKNLLKVNKQKTKLTHLMQFLSKK